MYRHYSEYVFCVCVCFDLINSSQNISDSLSIYQIRSDQSLSCVRLFATPWIAGHQASLSITNSRSSLRLMSIESVMPSSHLILSSPSPPAPNPSQHQSLFQWVSSLHEVAKVLEFQLKHQSFQRNPRADLIANLDFLNLSIPNVNNILIKPPNNFLSSNFLYLIIWICIPFSWGFYLSSRNIKMLSE